MVIKKPSRYEEEDEATRKGKTNKIPLVREKILEEPALPKKLDRTAITRAFSEDEEDRGQIFSKIRRKTKKEKAMILKDLPKITREVTIPETITVGELANRMAERSSDVMARRGENFFCYFFFSPIFL